MSQSNFFSDDLMATAAALLDSARAQRLKIVSAESCTGGLIAALLTEIPGSSDVLERGYVTYSNVAKVECLGVSAQLIEQHGAVSREAALGMVDGAVKHAHADLGVAVTGVAGPDGGTAQKPVGCVHIAVHRKGHLTRHKEYQFGNIGRSAIRLATVREALALIQKMIEN